MMLRTGILGETEGWKTILGQEGVPHAVVQGDLTPDAFSAVVVNDAVDDREISMVRDYLHLGGSVLCSSKVLSAIRGTTRNQKRMDYLLPEAGSIFAGIGIVDVHHQGYIPWNANELRGSDGAQTAFVGEFEGGHCIALPVDPSDLISTWDTQRRSFYSAANRLPFESVSSVGKNGLRRLVRRALEHLHTARGLPYIHLWYYPDKAPTVFTFRIDTDYGSIGDIEHVYEFLRAARIPGTWFVDVKSQEGFLWRYAHMQGQEIGIHCYEHKTFKDEPRNHENIMQARHRFRDAKLGGNGFAAPYGRWNPGLGRVLKEFRFDYSSEFGWDYDNLPSAPWIDSKSRGILQIPVHPISVGSLVRQGYRVHEMIDYFNRVIEEKLAHHEPLMFFHHPKDGNLEVLKALVDRAESAGARMMTMGEYAAWWEGRASEGMRVQWKDDHLTVDADTAPKGYAFRLMRGKEEEAFVLPTEKVRLDSLSWGSSPGPYTVPVDISRAREFNPRIPLTVAVDALFSFRRKRA